MGSEPLNESSDEATPTLARRRWPRRVGAIALAIPLLAFGFLFLGLRHQKLAPSPRAAESVPATLTQSFAYPEQGRAVQIYADLERAESETYIRHFVQFPVTTPGDAQPHHVQVWHYAPRRDDRRPAVVVTPIMGGTQEVARIIARALAERGLHAAIVLRAERYLDASADDARLERVLRTAVIDRRRAIDWLQGLPTVDPQRVGAVGVSLGGIVTSILASVEPRVRAAVLLMAGGDMASVVATSAEPRVQRYVKERAALGITPEENERRIRAALRFDPLRLAVHADPRRLLVVQTRFDRAIPFPTQVALWKALGEPERYVLPTGHYTIALYLPWLQRRVVEFLHERLTQ